MSKWLYKMDVKDIRKKIDSEEYDIFEIAKDMAKKIEEASDELFKIAKNPLMRNYKDSIVALAEELRYVTYYDFLHFSDDADGDEEDFDDLMDGLYDIADTSLDGRFGGDKLMWINA